MSFPKGQGNEVPGARRRLPVIEEDTVWVVSLQLQFKGETRVSLETVKLQVRGARELWYAQLRKVFHGTLLIVASLFLGLVSSRGGSGTE